MHNIENIFTMNKADLMNKLDFCEQISAKIKNQLLGNKEFYLHLHNDATIPSSIAMSALTNSVYSQCDTWSALNKMVAYNIRQDNSLHLIEKSHNEVKDIWSMF